MTAEDIAELRVLFTESLDPIYQELRVHRGVLDEHTALLTNVEGILSGVDRRLTNVEGILDGVDRRLTNVEGILDGVEILVRRKTG